MNRLTAKDKEAILHVGLKVAEMLSIVVLALLTVAKTSERIESLQWLTKSSGRRKRIANAFVHERGSIDLGGALSSYSCT